MPGSCQKLDAIDTDQITPAADCVSESLETPRRALEGGLVPLSDARLPRPRAPRRDVRHRGRPLRDRLVARDEPGRASRPSPKKPASSWSSSAATTWATSSAATPSTSDCTSSRAPRRSPTRVTATRSTFDPASRRLRERDAGHRRMSRCRSRPRKKRSAAAAASSRSGRREFRGVGARPRPSIDWPDAAPRRRMTTTEQILWAHRVDKASRRQVEPGATLRVYADLLPASDGTAPFAIHTFNQITGGATIFPRQAAIANDHFVFTGRDDDDKQTAIGREFARAARHRDAVLRDARRRHLPLLLSRTGARDARAVHSRRRLAQPRLRRLRRGRHRRRIDDARVRLGDGLHLCHARAGSAASCSTGRLQPWVSGKDIVLELLRRWGAKQSQGMSVELVDADGAAADAVSQHDRQHDGRRRRR